MNISEKVGGRIRIVRENRQLSSTELAEKIGMSRQLITNWEKGRRVPTLESIISLSNTLSAPVTFLLGLSDSLDSPTERQFTLRDLDEFGTNVSQEDISVPIQFLEKDRDYVVIRMKDDSMETLVRKNDLVMIELNQPVNDGYYVLFKINKTEQTLFRKYVINNSDPVNPQCTLMALNSSYPAIKYDSKAITILGICKDNLRLVG